MAQRGRKSAASLAVIRSIADHRPPPPDDLTPAQVAVWQRIVDRMPSDWFKPETHPLLAALCRHIVMAGRIAKLLDEYRDEWVAADGGLERLERLARMADREHRAMSAMATKLRLTLQSRYVPHRAATEAQRGTTGPRPWEDVPTAGAAS